MNSFLPDEQTPGAFAEARAQLGKELIVNRSLPTRALREHPDLDQLKRQAKELLQAFIAGDEKTAAEVNAITTMPIVRRLRFTTRNWCLPEPTVSTVGRS